MFDSQPSDAFQTKTDIAATLDAVGARPNRRFGQNFLIDRNLMNKLIDAAELKANDCVLEVGAGTGSLTGLLLDRVAEVVTVEIDPRLIQVIVDRLGDCLNLTVVPGDCLHNKSTLAPALVAALHEAAARAGGALKLVANLPYDAATPLVVDLLLSDLPLRRLCFTVQTEVAERFLAKPSTRDFGPVSIISQALTEGRRIGRCPPQAFWPAPNVHSTMIRLDVRPDRPAELQPPGPFAEFVRSMFLHRRKTLANNARTRPDAAAVLAAFEQIGLDGGSRPENVSVAQWIALWAALR